MRTILLVTFILTAAITLAQNHPERIVSGLKFTEGPTVSPKGILYFSDVPARRIYKYTPESGVEVFLENSGGVNGLFFGPEGNLFACSGKEKREIMKIDPQGNIMTIANAFSEKKLNSPNDLWVDSNGGIYFTDPRYGNRDNMEQEGEFVYYLSPDRQQIHRIIDDLVRPNGIVGSIDGKKLYIVDQGVQQTFVYDVIKPGQLKNKKLFAKCGIDGMSVGKKNDVFITAENSLHHYTKNGKLIHRYSFQAHPTNVYYHQGIAYVTTQAGEVFRIPLEN